MSPCSSAVALTKGAVMLCSPPNASRNLPAPTLARAASATRRICSSGVSAGRIAGKVMIPLARKSRVNSSSNSSTWVEASRMAAGASAVPRMNVTVPS